jgi:MFS family permease
VPHAPTPSITPHLMLDALKHAARVAGRGRCEFGVTTTHLSDPPRSAAAVAETRSGGATALILAGLLLTLLVAALDSTIVATAMPRIVGELGGFDRYTWIATAYLVTSTVAVPIVGKLADQFGRRPFLLGGTLFFLATSLLCSVAGSLEQLVGFRALQGAGGGIITAAVFAAVPTLFSAVARARIVGLFTGTYGLASILGPLLGGAVTDTLGWRAIFALNLPIGLVALAIIAATYPGRAASPVRPVVDYLGAALLVAGIGRFS